MAMTPEAARRHALRLLAGLAGAAEIGRAHV